MKPEIKEQAAEILANTKSCQWNFLHYQNAFAKELACSTIHFDLDYWDEDVTIADEEEIAEAVNAKLATMDLKSILLAA